MEYRLSVAFYQLSLFPESESVGGCGLRRVAPVCSVAENGSHNGHMVDRVGLVTGLEVEYLAKSSVVGYAASEHLTA